MNQNQQSKMEDLESLRALLAFKGNYHNHKETMAHAAIAIQIGILTVLLTMQQQPVWLSCFSQKLLFTVIYLAIWLIITWYMKWQLYYAKIAADQVFSLIEKIKEKAEQDVRPLIGEMQDIRGSTQKPIPSQYILWIADLLVLIIVILKVWLLW